MGKISSWDTDSNVRTITRRVLNPQYVAPRPPGNSYAYDLFCDRASPFYDPPLCIGAVGDVQPSQGSEPEYIYETVTIPDHNKPLHGVRVRARRFLVSRDDFTDKDGNYHIGSFRYNVHYSVRWERHQFNIRSGVSGGAEYNGPTRRTGWNLSIPSTSIHRFYADIHRGAYHYYYKGIKGLRRPPENGIFHIQMKIAAVNGYDWREEIARGRWAGLGRFIGSQIKIWREEPLLSPCKKRLGRHLCHHHS